MTLTVLFLHVARSNSYTQKYISEVKVFHFSPFVQEARDCSSLWFFFFCHSDNISDDSHSPWKLTSTRSTAGDWKNPISEPCLTHPAKLLLKLTWKPQHQGAEIAASHIHIHNYRNVSAHKSLSRYIRLNFTTCSFPLLRGDVNLQLFKNGCEMPIQICLKNASLFSRHFCSSSKRCIHISAIETLLVRICMEENIQLVGLVDR